MNNKKNKLSIGTENIISLKDFADKLNKTKKTFPKVGLIYSASGYFKPEIYEQVIMSYNNPKLTKLLAKFVDYIFDSYQPEEKKFQPAKNMILDYIGADITDNELSKYKAFQHKPVNSIRSRLICRMAPNGLHPHAIAQKYGYKDGGYIGSDLLPRAFISLLQEHGHALQAVVDAYIRGDQQAMLDAMPEKLRKELFQQEYKTSNMPLDELNKAGEWLKNNMKFER